MLHYSRPGDTNNVPAWREKAHWDEQNDMIKIGQEARADVALQIAVRRNT